MHKSRDLGIEVNFRDGFKEDEVVQRQQQQQGYLGHCVGISKSESASAKLMLNYASKLAMRSKQSYKSNRKFKTPVGHFVNHIVFLPLSRLRSSDQRESQALDLAFSRPLLGEVRGSCLSRVGETSGRPPYHSRSVSVATDNIMDPIEDLCEPLHCAQCLLRWCLHQQRIQVSEAHAVSLPRCSFGKLPRILHSRVNVQQQG